MPTSTSPTDSEHQNVSRVPDLGLQVDDIVVGVLAESLAQTVANAVAQDAQTSFALPLNCDAKSQKYPEGNANDSASDPPAPDHDDDSNGTESLSKEGSDSPNIQEMIVSSENKEGEDGQVTGEKNFFPVF